MAGDKSSPNEAAIAAKQARFLMDKYQIEEMDLTSLNESDMGIEDFHTTWKRVPPWLGSMAIAVAKHNDCIAEYDRDPQGKYKVVYKGLLVDAVCATEELKYLIEAMKKGAYWVNGHANVHAFKLGFAKGIYEQVKEMLEERAKMKSHGKSLVVLKDQLVTQHFGPARYRSARARTFSGDRSAFEAGRAKGKSTSLNRQVTTGTGKPKGYLK